MFKENVFPSNNSPQSLNFIHPILTHKVTAVLHPPLAFSPISKITKSFHNLHIITQHLHWFFLAIFKMFAFATDSVVKNCRLLFSFSFLTHCAPHHIRHNSFSTHTTRIYVANCNFTFCTTHHHPSLSNIYFQSLPF